MKKHYFIDLLCGCGGFSLGIERAGLGCLAAVDCNPEAIAVFQKDFAHVPQVLDKDLTKFAPPELAKLIGTDSVDVIVGGPPCQGFSTVRHVDGANNGKRMVADDRRHLYQEFLRYVEFFQPKVFVMENVLGIRSASGGEYFTRVQKEAKAITSIPSRLPSCTADGRRTGRCGTKAPTRSWRSCRSWKKSCPMR